MATVPIDQASERLPELFARARAGEEVVIDSGDQGRMRLVPTQSTVRGKRPLGTLVGRIREAPGVWDPLSDEELREMGL